jgi:hypothetical protein
MLLSFVESYQVAVYSSREVLSIRQLLAPKSQQPITDHSSPKNPPD